MIKILLSGNDSEIKNKFFSCADAEFKILSTTENPADIKNHIEFFKPDIFIYCAENQTFEQLVFLEASHEFISGMKFILIGTDTDMDMVFPRFGSEKIHMTLSKELGIDTVLERAKKFILEEDKNQSDASTPPIDFGIEVLDYKADNHGDKVGMKKILIIDDDVNVLRTLKLALQNKYTISVASSGNVALKFLETKTVDLILLDYMMPDMNGPEILNNIRQSNLTSRIPVVFLTGVSDKEKIRQIMSMNIQGYLLKPVDTQKLLECVNRVLQN